MSNAIWRFPTTFDGGGIGFNDGGTQLFKDDSIKSLAREVCQNSIDARHKDSDAPAEVEFKTFSIKTSDFPGYSDFYNIIKKEVKYCKNFYKNNKNAINYYNDALNTLESDEIICLRISDYNTTGLTVGDDPKNNNWANLVIHSGTNDKEDDDGGSFGLGKNAMYACSKFGTLFFSTFTDEGDKKSECIAKLSSYECDNGDIIHGLGFYGNYSSNRSYEQDKPIYDLFRPDSSFTRRDSETGTDVYILGFELPNSDIISGVPDRFSKFEADISAAIIDSYYDSILNNMLVVKINNIEINRENIIDIFNKIYNLYPQMFNVNTIDYLNIMCSDEGVVTKQICIMDPAIPDAELKIKLNPSFHNKVAMVRNTGMKIFDKGNFPQITLFSGTLKLKSKDVNGYFKKMENPAHDGWMIDRIKNDPTAKSKYDRMLAQIREAIKELANDSSTETLDAIGLGEFLPDDISSGNDDNKKEGIVDEIQEEIEVVTKKELPITSNTLDKSQGGDEPGIDKSGEEDEIGKFEIQYGQGYPNNTNGGSGSSGSAKTGDNKISISKDNIVKNVKTTHFYDNSGLYTFIIDSPIDMRNCKFEISLAGEQGNFIPEVSHAYKDRKILGKQNLNFDNNIIEIGKISKNEKVKIKFSLKDNENWSLEVNIYEN